MSAINFVVRDSAGNLQRGFLSGETGSNILNAGAGNDISLNLRRSQVMDYQRDGNNLVITLTDGRELVLSGYFPSGIEAPNELYISADGFMTEVALIDDSSAGLRAQYIDGESFGKWSPDDDLYFIRGQEFDVATSDPSVTDPEASMLGATLLGGLGGLGGSVGAGAAALGGAALLTTGGDGGGSGGGGSSETPDTTPPEVAAATGVGSQGYVVNAEDYEDGGIDIGGTGEPGATITVEVDGFTETTEVGEDGNWTVNFGPDTLPGGEYTTDIVVTATDAAGNSATTEDTLIVDTISEVAFAEGVTIAGDGLLNKSEWENGFEITGTTQPNSTVIVMIGTASFAADVAADGTWSLTVNQGDLDGGEYTTQITAIATDEYGNVSDQASMDLIVDTVSTVTLASGTYGGDSVVNMVESQSSDGVVLSGSAQPGSFVTVVMNNVTHTATANGDGLWSVTYSTAELPTGETTADVSVTAEDANGNVATTSGSVEFDTVVTDFAMTSGPVAGNNIINQAEAEAGVTVTGTVEAGSSVMVKLGDYEQAATVDAQGNWTITFAEGTIPSGEYPTTMVITATDVAQNVTSMTENVTVDTTAGYLTLSPLPIEGNDVVNAVEVADGGVMILGTATPFSTVNVSLGGVPHQATAGADGSWSSVFQASEIPAGTYDADIKASITDVNGNSLEVSDSVHIDTEVTNFGFDAAAIAGDNVISGPDVSNGGGSIMVSGTVEPGAKSVVVSMGEHSVNANINSAAGTWTASFSAAQIGEAEYDATITAVAIDKNDNVNDIPSRDVTVDTYVNELSVQAAQVEGDDIINAVEASDGFILSGRVEAGSQVAVKFENTTKNASVDAAGNWTVSFDAADIPPGKYDTTVEVMATDAVGNTDTVTDSFHVDTVVPDAPLIQSFEKGLSGVRGISTDQIDGTSEIDQIAANGAVSDVAYGTPEINGFGELEFEFDAPIPDGSHLMVTNTDTAGNDSSTLFVLDESGTNTVDLNNLGLSQFDVGAIDLQFAENSALTLTAADVEGLSDATNELRINGSGDDTVTMLGAQEAGTKVIAGKTYEAYTLGDEGGTVYIDDEINVVI